MRSVGKECCREVVEKGVVAKIGEESFREEGCREVLERSVVEKSARNVM